MHFVLCIECDAGYHILWFLYCFACPDHMQRRTKNTEIALIYCCFIYFVSENAVYVSLTPIRAFVTLTYSMPDFWSVPVSLVGNVSDKSADMSSRHSLSPCFGRQQTCRRHHDRESILVACRHISRHNIWEASAKLAHWGRCLLMSSWASHDIAQVADTSSDALSACRHVGS